GSGTARPRFINPDESVVVAIPQVNTRGRGSTKVDMEILERVVAGVGNSIPRDPHSGDPGRGIDVDADISKRIPGARWSGRRRVANDHATLRHRGHMDVFVDPERAAIDLEPDIREAVAVDAEMRHASGLCSGEGYGGRRGGAPRVFQRGPDCGRDRIDESGHPRPHQSNRSRSNDNRGLEGIRSRRKENRSPCPQSLHVSDSRNDGRIVIRGPIALRTECGVLHAHPFPTHIPEVGIELGNWRTAEVLKYVRDKLRHQLFAHAKRSPFTFVHDMTGVMLEDQMNPLEGSPIRGLPTGTLWSSLTERTKSCGCRSSQQASQVQALSQRFLREENLKPRPHTSQIEFQSPRTY